MRLFDTVKPWLDRAALLATVTSPGQIGQVAGVPSDTTSGLEIAAAAAASPAGHQEGSPSICTPGTTALVLSGGASPGLSHIGVLRALDEYGIRPDMIIGTSMGAVIGAMYASGYSGAEVDSIATRYPLSRVFPGYGPRLPRPLDERTALIAFEETERGFALDLTMADEGAAYELLNAALLRGNLAARGDFDALPIPFRAVATDLDRPDPVVLGSGDLVAAVRASLSIPLMFQPVQIDGRWLVDGGLTANVPIGVARRLGADYVIVSDATEDVVASEVDLKSPLQMVRVLSNRATKQRDSVGVGDIRIRPGLEGMPRRDFSPAWKARFVAEGRRAAQEAFGSADCLPVSPARRRTHQQFMWGSRRAADSDFGGPGTFGGLTVAGEVARHVIPAPERMIAVGGAFSSGLGWKGWLGAIDSRWLSGRLAGSAVVAAGSSQQELLLGVRPAAMTGAGVVATLELEREAIQLFDPRGSEIGHSPHWMLGARVSLERDFGGGWIASAGPLFVRRSGASIDTGFAVGAGASIERRAGTRMPTVRLAASAANAFDRMELAGSWPSSLGWSRVTPEVRLAWGRGLSAQQEWTLGGSVGFPGLQIGEGRAASELMARLGASYPLLGPLRLRLEAAAAANRAYGFAESPTWLRGARVGLGVDSFFGPFAIDYGRNSLGRGAWSARIGRWF